MRIFCIQVDAGFWYKHLEMNVHYEKGAVKAKGNVDSRVQCSGFSAGPPRLSAAGHTEIGWLSLGLLLVLIGARADAIHDHFLWAAS
jgi:hypothetical protein